MKRTQLKRRKGLNKQTPKHKRTKRTNYKDKLWKLFSRYIRMRDKGVCFTCGDTRHWKQQQAGHFIHNVLDIDEMNINCQCVRCNKFLHGNGVEYALRLIKKYGLDAVEDLKRRATFALAGEIVSDEEYEAKIKYYTDKIKELENGANKSNI